MRAEQRGAERELKTTQLLSCMMDDIGHFRERLLTMATLPFVCNSQPLSAAGLCAAATTIGVDVATIWAILAVETSGCGYLSDRRPQILYERHIFHRLTDGVFDAKHAGISSDQAGGYGRGGGAQYPRLGEAVALARSAALQSAS